MRPYRIYLIIKSGPFHIDDHRFEAFDVFEFGNIFNLLNIRSIRASSENSTDETTIFAWRGIRTSHEGSDRVIDDSSDMDGKFSLVDFRLKDLDDILTDSFLIIGSKSRHPAYLNVESLCPSHKFPGIDFGLNDGKTECET